MPPPIQRLTFIPDHAALALLGRDVRPGAESGRVSGGTAAVNGVLAEYAALLLPAARDLVAAITRPEWSALADCCNGWLDLSDSSEIAADPIPALCQQLADADRFSGLGKKWGVKVASLCERLAALSPIHGTAVFAAVRWFWEHAEAINPEKDPWWEPAFRTQAAKK